MELVLFPFNRGDRGRELTNLLKLNLLTKGEAVFQTCSLALLPRAGLFLPLGVFPPLSTIHTPSSPHTCPSPALGYILTCHNIEGGCSCCPGDTVQQGPGDREDEE